MPKLSKNSLKKRFTCHYCDKSVRTRQGLAGHIQFKHGTKQKSKQIDAEYIMSMVTRVELWGRVWGLSESAIKARQMILVNWLEVQALCDFLHIDLNTQDFKNYLIARLAQIQGKGS